MKLIMITDEQTTQCDLIVIPVNAIAGLEGYETFTRIVVGHKFYDGHTLTDILTAMAEAKDDGVPVSVKDWE